MSVDLRRTSGPDIPDQTFAGCFALHEIFLPDGRLEAFSRTAIESIELAAISQCSGNGRSFGLKHSRE
jgi:hypothetical protein